MLARLISGWICVIDRIVADISVEVELVVISDRIDLQEPSERRRVDAGLVVIHPDLGQPDLPGILEPSHIGGAGDAIFVVAVDAPRAPGVADRDDRALVVGVEVGGEV
jgi:hypothetical protein